MEFEGMVCGCVDGEVVGVLLDLCEDQAEMLWWFGWWYFMIKR
jgi:hypothetical protein